MYTFVDWKAVAVDVAEASENNTHQAVFHVLDIQELANLASNCKNADAFSNRLLQRWCFIKERGHAYVRAKFPVGMDPHEGDDEIAP
jgi:hypothetical protein